MELLEEKTQALECKIGDVTFLIRARANAYDKHLIATSSMAKVEGNVARIESEPFFRLLVQRFVIGWRGVTSGGKPVAYSYDLLADRFPIVHGDEVFMRLGDFICSNTDILLSDEARKNASAVPSAGN